MKRLTFFTFHIFRRATLQGILVPILSERTLQVRRRKLSFLVKGTLDKLITVIGIRVETDVTGRFKVVTRPYTRRDSRRRRGKGIVIHISVEQLVHVPAVANKTMFKFVFTFEVKRNANKYDYTIFVYTILPCTILTISYHLF